VDEAREGDCMMNGWQRCLVCGAEYLGQHYCPNIKINWGGHSSPLSVYTWYKCPNCQGQFSQWDAVQSTGSVMRQYCPFCGMEKGMYKPVKEEGK